MLGENHSLYNEFPQLREAIHAHKLTDAHFNKLANEYDELDHMIRNLENEGVPTTDEHIEALKLRRVKLKDSIYAMINE